MPSKKNPYTKTVTLSPGYTNYNEFEISKNYPSIVFWPYYIKSSYVVKLFCLIKVLIVWAWLLTEVAG